MKRIRVISLAVIAALSLTVTSFAADSSPQQQSAAAYLREVGIMLGNESGDMMLKQGLTRAQMAALLTRVVADPEQFETDSAFTAAFAALRMFRNGQKAMWATAPQIIWLQGMAMDATAPMTLLLLRQPAR